MGAVASRAEPLNYKIDDYEFTPPSDWSHVEFDANPFASGSCRDAFQGTIYSTKDDHCTMSTMYCSYGWVPDSEGEKITYRCVVKTFKRIPAMNAKAWTKDMRLLAKCQQLANDFNVKVNPRRKISFAKPVLFKVTDIKFGTTVGKTLGVLALSVVLAGTAEVALPLYIVSLGVSFLSGVSMVEEPKTKTEEYIFVEPYLSGRFKKLNSNSGWFSSSDDSQVAHAFSHWTWHHTGGQLLVCDLQGVRSGDDWLLTDPAAHSPSTGSLGPTDCGLAGIESFFHGHICNRLCRHLPRPTLNSSSPPMQPSQNSSFAWEMANASLMVHLQQGGTCYANACATVVRAAESRIVGRKVETHIDMVERIVKKHGSDGGNCKTVLKEECPARRLRWKSISKTETEEAIRKGHPILLSFRISDQDWKEFSDFFKNNPLKSLSRLPEKTWSQWWSEKKIGHAVVITGQSKQCWYIKNSWGDNFAAKGYFKIEKKLLESLTHEFVHVFWYESDLTDSDRAAFSRQQR